MSYYWGPPLSRGRGDEGRVVVAPEFRHVLTEMSQEESPQAKKSAARQASTGGFSLGRSGDLQVPSSPSRPRQQGPRREEPLSGCERHCVDGVPWQTATLFGGERVATNLNLRRGSAVMFRRHKHSRATPHQRPIFLAGPNGVDPKMCVDIHDPSRFSSFERGVYERQVKQGGQGSRRPSLAPSASAPALGWGRSDSRASTPASSIGGHSRPGSVQGFLNSAVSSGWPA